MGIECQGKFVAEMLNGKWTSSTLLDLFEKMKFMYIFTNGKIQVISLGCDWGQKECTDDTTLSVQAGQKKIAWWVAIINK